ncbi:MAG TPA: DUF302 domain-containing protein [Holophagaceae bacterium]
MYHLVESGKPFEQAAADLEAAVKAGGFGVLYVHDLGNTLRSKGHPFTEQCRIFEVCNPAQAATVLARDLRLNMALPCRISVYTDRGRTWIGLIRPAEMLAGLTQDEALRPVAAEVEASLVGMVDAAR